MEAPSKNDDALIEAAQAGDRQALEQLVERYQGRVYRFGMKMCRDPEDAKDIVQETLLAMARTLSGFRGDSKVSTWLYGIARSFCIKKRRRSKFAPQEMSLDSDGRREARQIADPERGPDEQANAHELRQALGQEIARLESGQREVLLLRDVEGLTAPEVAQVLDITVAAVKSRLHRARAAVRQHLAPWFEPALQDAATPSDCPDVVTLFSQYLEGEISPNRCEEMQRHLDRCGNCHQACESLKRTLSLCQTVPEPEIPNDVAASVREAIRAFLDQPNDSTGD